MTKTALGALFICSVGLVHDSFGACPALPTPNANETVDPAMAASYTSYPLPAIPGAMNIYPGGIAIDPNDINLFYFVDLAEDTTAQVRSIRAVRDACNHVVSWSDTSALVGNTPSADASLLNGSHGTLFFTEYPQNTIGQLQMGDSTTTWLTDLSTLGVDGTPPHTNLDYGPGGLVRVPAGYTTANQLRVMTYGGDFYSLPFTEDPITGQLTFSNATYLIGLGVWEGGMGYIAAGSPGLTGAQLLVLEYDNSTISAYATDSTGLPSGARTQILSVAAYGWGGGMQDPLSADVYWGSWEDGQYHVLSGFVQPTCSSDSDCHSSLRCDSTTSVCVQKCTADFGAMGGVACTSSAPLCNLTSGVCGALVTDMLAPADLRAVDLGGGPSSDLSMGDNDMSITGGNDSGAGAADAAMFIQPSLPAPTGCSFSPNAPHPIAPLAALALALLCLRRRANAG